jgi:hypothetical protein
MSVFNGVKVFAATLAHQRGQLGEAVTAWLEAAAQQRPGFAMVDILVRQSSDDGFHCVTFVIFYKEDRSKEIY